MFQIVLYFLHGHYLFYILYDTTYIALVTEAEYKSESQPAKDRPYFVAFDDSDLLLHG